MFNPNAKECYMASIPQQEAFPKALKKELIDFLEKKYDQYKMEG